MDDMPPLPPCSARILLEAVSATVPRCQWGVSAIPSAGRLFVWDARDESSFAALDFVAVEFGAVEDSAAIEAGGQRVIGCIIQPIEADDLNDIAGRFRADYAIATGEAKPDRPDPF